MAWFERDPESPWQPVEKNKTEFPEGSLGHKLECTRIQVEKEHKLERLIMRGVTEGEHPDYCDNFDSCNQCIKKCELW